MGILRETGFISIVAGNFGDLAQNIANELSVSNDLLFRWRYRLLGAQCCYRSKRKLAKSAGRKQPFFQL